MKRPWTPLASRPWAIHPAVAALALSSALACAQTSTEIRSSRSEESAGAAASTDPHEGDSGAGEGTTAERDAATGQALEEGSAIGRGVGSEAPVSGSCTFATVAIDQQVDSSADFVAAPVSERFGLCSSGGWCWVNPMPHGHDLRASWAIDSDDVLAVTGGGGLVRQYRGAWSTVSTGLAAHFYDVWASGQDDIWVVGVAVDSSSEGIVAHFDGASWSIAVEGLRSPLFSAWGSGPEDVWAVGAEGLLAHWDGTAWSEPSSGQQQEDLDGVWGSGPSDVWAVGRGTLIHWDGSSWSTSSAIPDNFDLEAVWGSSESDVWAVGHGYQFTGTLHYDGVGWTEVNTIADTLFYDVWGTGPDDVWAVGFTSGAAGATVAHWDGSRWSSDSAGSSLGTTHTNDIFRSLTGTGVDDVWAMGNGGTVIHHDGQSWTRTAPTTLASRTSFGAVWSNSASDAWAVGYNFEGPTGSIVHWDGESWAPSEEGVPETRILHDVWSDGPDDVWVVGDGHGSDTILRYDGTRWSVAYEAERVGLNRIWGSAGDDVWVYGGIFNARCGGFDVTTLMHWDGSSWSTETFEIELTDMWGSGPEDVWAVGGNTILHYDGSSWSTVTTCAPGVQSVWGSGPSDVWVAGDEMFHWDGSQWSSADLGRVRGALWGSASDDVWVASEHRILHFDGESWSSSPSGTSFRIRDVSGSGANDVWAVGEEGMILHRQGGPEPTR